MDEKFRVSQKLGLMFKTDDDIPKNIKSWAISQLHEKSPVLGIKSVSRVGSTTTPSKVMPWPESLQPDLEERARRWRIQRAFMELSRKEKKSNSEIQRNNQENLFGRTDELKFSHRNVYGNDQVRIRFMSFWTNHFTMGNIHDNQNVIGHAMDEAILANLNNHFSEMLYKVTTHPAMLIYLDNIWSAGENSKKAKDCRNKVDCQAGLNDNLGRELLELHTVSPSANYTEDDIRNSAKVLAGWGTMLEETLKDMRKQGKTTDHWNFFKKYYAEPGNKTVMGKTISSGKGGLRQLTDFLANHEHTIKHISTKLCRHFISDSPKNSDINQIANTWRQSKGDLDKIHSKVIELAILSKEAKFQWPMTWIFQVIRLSGATYIHGWDQIYNWYDDAIMGNNEIFEELGQSFWVSRQPNGYSSKKEEWLSGEMFERRVRFASAIFRGGDTKHSTEKIMDRIGASNSTRKLVNSVGSSKENRFIALMCSPELMGLESA
jgi:uncharacterized protein (DUF1800 family)